MDEYIKSVTRDFLSLIISYLNREIDRQTFESYRSTIREFLEIIDIDIFTREVNALEYDTWYVI